MTQATLFPKPPALNFPLFYRDAEAINYLEHLADLPGYEDARLREIAA